MMAGKTLQAPALLISASSHRSGSTLLQRYVTAATDVFVWGENGRFVQAMREAYETWPHKPSDGQAWSKVMDDPTAVERSFIPNLSPPRDTMLEALRTAFCRTYDRRPTGFARWGWKDVGYALDDLHFVRELFPEIRIVLLVRDPWDVARSIRRKGWIDRRGYFRDMEEVARLWMERSRDYRRLAEAGDPRVHLVRYEQLERELAGLNAFLGIEGRAVWERVAKKRLGAAPTLSRFDFTSEDVSTVERVAGEVAESFGYEANP